VDEKHLTVHALQKKKKPPVPAPGGKKAPKNKPNNYDPNDDASKKDNKKSRK